MALLNKSSKTRHPAYQAWISLRYRCNNPQGKNECYKNISFDANWESFENFWNDMGATWKPGLTIDRIDSKENYCKDNCSWVDKFVQANNRSSNRKIIFNGETMLLHKWSEYLGIKPTTITQRIDSYGWSIERALSTPVRRILL